MNCPLTAKHPTGAPADGLRLILTVAILAFALVMAFPCIKAFGDEGELSTTVIFDANGPAATIHAETGSESVTVPEIEIDFEGLEFTGKWNTTRWGTGDAYAVGDALTESMTLYAQWEDGTHLFTAADTTALDAVIEKAEAIDLSRYTDKTAQTVEEALSAARALIDAEADSQAEVDAAADALDAAIASLEEKPLAQKAVDAIVSGGKSSTSSSISEKSGNSYDKTGAGVLPIVIGIALILVTAGLLLAVHLRKRKEFKRRRALYLNMGQPDVKTSGRTSRRLKHKRGNR